MSISKEPWALIIYPIGFFVVLSFNAIVLTLLCWPGIPPVSSPWYVVSRLKRHIKWSPACFLIKRGSKSFETSFYMVGEEPFLKYLSGIIAWIFVICNPNCVDAFSTCWLVSLPPLMSTFWTSSLVSRDSWLSLCLFLNSISLLNPLASLIKSVELN